MFFSILSDTKVSVDPRTRLKFLLTCFILLVLPYALVVLGKESRPEKDEDLFLDA